MGYGNRHGFNAVFSGKTIGTHRAVCTRISHGLQIIAGEDESAFRRGYYPRASTRGSFSITVVFANYALYTAFGQFMTGYGEKAARGIGDPAMRVSVAARNFDRYAVPVSGMTFGRGVEDVVYQMTIGFVGGRDATEGNSYQASKYIAPRVDANHGVAISPAGTQLSGTAVGADYKDDFSPIVDLGNPDGFAPTPDPGNVDSNGSYVGNM